jgi:hypothetical protein
MYTYACPAEPRRPRVREAPRVRTVERYAFWATGFERGPLQISADDDDNTMRALFQASDSPDGRSDDRVAFSVGADPKTCCPLPRIGRG